MPEVMVPVTVFLILTDTPGSSSPLLARMVPVMVVGGSREPEGIVLRDNTMVLFLIR